MKKKNRIFSARTLILLSASALLLVGSTVGSTRATLNYTSKEYRAKLNVSEIGVSLNENGTVVATDDGTKGALLGHLESEKIVPGNPYTEELSVTNSGVIDSYVRVILTKSWTKDGKDIKDRNLSPDLIQLEFARGSGWFVDKDASTKERTVLYYSKPLGKGDTTNPLSENLVIDSSIGAEVESSKQTDANGNVIVKHTYKYDGYQFNLEAEVDAVQKNNAVAAIKSAWGVDVSLNGDTISMAGGELQ